MVISQPPNNKPEGEPPKKRADPYFKMLTNQLMSYYGLIVGDTNISQAMELDLVVAKPDNLDLEDFFLPSLKERNMIEFKGRLKSKGV